MGPLDAVCMHVPAPGQGASLTCQPLTLCASLRLISSRYIMFRLVCAVSKFVDPTIPEGSRTYDLCLAACDNLPSDADQDRLSAKIASAVVKKLLCQCAQAGNPLYVPPRGQSDKALLLKASTSSKTTNCVLLQSEEGSTGYRTSDCCTRFHQQSTRYADAFKANRILAYLKDKDKANVANCQYCHVVDEDQLQLLDALLLMLLTTKKKVCCWISNHLMHFILGTMQNQQHRI